MQVKFKWGTKKQIEELMKVRPSITEAEVYFDKEDGSLYVVSFNLKNESKTSFEKYRNLISKIGLKNEIKYDII